MMILSAQGSLQPVRRAQSWAMERLIYVHVSGELRWAMLARPGFAVVGLDPRARAVCAAVLQARNPGTAAC